MGYERVLSEWVMRVWLTNVVHTGTSHRKTRRSRLRIFTYRHIFINKYRVQVRVRVRARVSIREGISVSAGWVRTRMRAREDRGR